MGISCDWTVDKVIHMEWVVGDNFLIKTYRVKTNEMNSYRGKNSGLDFVEVIIEVICHTCGCYDGIRTIDQK